MSKLTHKQQEFITEYLRDLNATQAAKRAGYKASTENGFASIGSENLRKPKIKAEIEKRLNANAMSANEVIYRLSQQARASVDDFFDFYGNLPSFNVEKAKKRGVIGVIKKFVVTDKEFRVEFHDGQKALELLGRYHALFSDKVQIEDWRSKAIEYIRNGELDYEVMKDEFGTDLATELFKAAGVPIEVG